MVLLDERKVELVCSACGYGIVSAVPPATCPMCHEGMWERPAWRPFSTLPEFREPRPMPDEVAL